MNELVSIITPTFNSEKFIAETIESVQNQTYQNWEMIIIDDCSTDKTTDIIKNILQNDNRIVILQNDKNQGSGISRQLGLNKARGRFVAFLDADDLWQSNKLEKQIAFLKTNGLAFTFSYYSLIDERSQPLNIHLTSPSIVSLKQLKYCNYIGNLTGIYDATILGKINISPIRKRQDWIMWLDILKKTKIVHVVPEYLALYRVRKKSLSSNKINLLKYNFNVYRYYWGYSFFMSLINMIIFLYHQIFFKTKYIKKVSQIA